ncbi:MAG: GGDEF domain-containing protein [Gammaproteobacteria bacterium]|jgi:diguanylate cyclase (GGDEF)-like protein|nr:GGDEF domain-containing protein [Gammaproteobacteria bacterium]
MQPDRFNWGAWPAALTSERLALLLPCFGALFVLSIMSLGELSMLQLAIALGLLAAYACGALVLLATRLVAPTRAPLLLTLLMFSFAVLLAVAVYPQTLAVLLLLPALHAVMRLSDRGVNTVLVVAALAWVALRSWPLPPAPLTLLLSLVELLPAAVLLLVAYALNRALATGRRQVAAAASRDPLTNLLNMQAFDRLLQVQHADAVAGGACYALLLIDIDGLRNFNERYGYGGGNRILVAVADAIRRSVRAGDLVARFAGDEFVVCLPDASDDTVSALANRVAQNVYNIMVSFERSAARVVVDTGAALYPESGREVDDLLQFAASALERNKAFRRSSATPRAQPAPLRQQAGVDDWS